MSKISETKAKLLKDFSEDLISYRYRSRSSRELTERFSAALDTIQNESFQEARDRIGHLKGAYIGSKYVTGEIEEGWVIDRKSLEAFLDQLLEPEETKE